MSDADLPRIGAASWWYKLTFYVDGFVACLLKGRLHLYDELVGQALHETGQWTGKGWTNYGNPFSMHVGRLSSRRTGEVDFDGGGFATYIGPGAMWRAWQDRLEWDDAMGADVSKEGVDYMRSVVNHGYLGLGPAPQRVEAYIKAWQAMMAKVPWLVKVLGSSGTTLRFLVNLLPVIVILVVGWVLYKNLRSRRRGH